MNCVTFFLLILGRKRYIVLVTYFIILGCSCTGQFDCNQSLLFIDIIFKREDYLFVLKPLHK